MKGEDTVGDKHLDGKQGKIIEGLRFLYELACFPYGQKIATKGF